MAFSHQRRRRGTNFDEYSFRTLRRTGGDAKDGAKNYLVNGQMTRAPRS
ncbi:DUF2950 family protein [Tunturiibacter psychrotolerans]